MMKDFNVVYITLASAAFIMLIKQAKLGVIKHHGNTLVRQPPIKKAFLLGFYAVIHPAIYRAR